MIQDQRNFPNAGSDSQIYFSKGDSRRDAIVYGRSKFEGMQ